MTHATQNTKGQKMIQLLEQLLAILDRLCVVQDPVEIMIEDSLKEESK